MAKEAEVVFEVKVAPAAGDKMVPKAAPGGRVVGPYGVLHISG